LIAITLTASGAASAADLTPVEVFECDDGFYYDAAGDVCTRNACVCPKGTPVSSEACTVHEGHQCFDCNAGYGLDEDDHCVPAESLPHVGSQARPDVPRKVCRNGDVRRANLTLVAWLETPDFLECTDLLLNLRVGNSGDAGAKAVAAALIRAGSKSNVEHVILTQGAITNEGAEWLAAAMGAELPEYEGDDVPEDADAPILDDAASDMMDTLGADADEYETARITQIAEALSRTIGTVSLPRRRPKGVGLPPITDINLYQNRIGDAGAEAFADALSSNKMLRTVHLSHNEITLTGFRALLEVVLSREARHIEQLWLDGNSFDMNSRKMQPLMDQMRRQLDLNEKRGLRARGIKMDL
jgi:hypothetical protein